MCSFEGMKNLARWLSWLERRPVTAEVVGSSPIRVVLTEYVLHVRREFSEIVSLYDGFRS